MLLQLTFQIAPQPKQRPRTSLLDQDGQLRSKPVTWTPEATRLFEETIQLQAMGHLAKLGISRPAIPAPEPVFFAPTFFLTRPKGKTGRRPFPTGRPDRDNLEKAIADAFNGVLWTDDSQVIDGPARKRWTTTDRPWIKVIVADLEGMDRLFPLLSPSLLDEPPVASGL